MSNNLITLLKIEQINRFGFHALSHEKDKKKKYRTLALMIVVGFVILMMAGYCFGLAYAFGHLGISEVVPGYALTISSLVIMFFTFFKANGILFASRDYDMLMAFPIQTQTVITAKFLSMYLTNLLCTIVVMVPMAIGYAVWNGVSVMGGLAWIVTILFAPLLPMTLAVIVGTFIIAIGSGFKHKAFVQMFLMILLVVGISGTSFWMQSSATKDEAAFLATLTDMGAMLSQTIHKVYPLSAWFDGAVNEGDLVDLLLLVGVSVLLYGIFAGVCSKYYRKINSALHSHHAASNYKIGELKSSSIMMALVKKEAKRFFSSSLYMMNIGMGLIMALLVSIASIFIGVDKIIEGIEIPNIDNVKPVIAYVIPFAIALIVNMCNTCSVSLSLEGRNRWIVQSLPIDNKTLLKGKMMFNIILVLPVSLLCSLIFIFELHVNFILALFYLLFSVVSVLFSTVWGMWINLHFPNYQWQNEVEVIKQGISSMIAIFSSMLGYFALAVVVIFLSSMISIELLITAACILLVAVGMVLYQGCK